MGMVLLLLTGRAHCQRQVAFFIDYHPLANQSCFHQHICIYGPEFWHGGQAGEYLGQVYRSRS